MSTRAYFVHEIKSSQSVWRFLLRLVSEATAMAMWPLNLASTQFACAYVVVTKQVVFIINDDSFN